MYWNNIIACWNWNTIVLDSSNTGADFCWKSPGRVSHAHLQQDQRNALLPNRHGSGARRSVGHGVHSRSPTARPGHPAVPPVPEHGFEGMDVTCTMNGVTLTSSKVTRRRRRTRVAARDTVALDEAAASLDAIATLGADGYGTQSFADRLAGSGALVVLRGQGGPVPDQARHAVHRGGGDQRAPRPGPEQARADGPAKFDEILGWSS
jgi:hypothetical protein